MELTRLIAALSDSAAYPRPVATVEVRQTHISVVFLAGEHVYKIKKPVKFSFVDFGTLAKREHFCREEVRLNARLAPEVYLDVVPIVAAVNGVRLEGTGKPIEWAVKMRRLADDDTLESRLARGQVSAQLVAAVARKIAAFHATAASSKRIAAFGRFDVVAANVRENLEQAQAHVGAALSPGVLARLQAATETELAEQRGLIEARAAHGMPRDTHGDLRLDHVYVRAGGTEPELAIIDCIEFNERFRYADPVADIAFLAMDLKYEGRRDLAGVLAEAYFADAGDDEGRCLLPLYTSYRAAVRGKVEGIRQAAPEVPENDRAEARERARGYWSLALGALEPPQKRPGLVLVAGLPGSGKSTLAAQLATRGEFQLIRSDVLRKELAGVAEGSAAGDAFGAGIYTREWNERTYSECLRRAEGLLFEGRRVLVDASFREEAQRRSFLDAAARWCVPAVLLLCQADSAVIRERLAARRGDASDADWSIYLAAAEAWQRLGPQTSLASRTIDTSTSRKQAVEAALAALRAFDLAG